MNQSDWLQQMDQGQGLFYSSDQHIAKLIKCEI